MSRYLFELARPDDDASLRGLIARNPLPGHMTLGFHREPSFFAAGEVEGSFRQTIVCRDLFSGAIIGLGTRSIRDRFHDGAIVPIGYLGSLRLDPDHRRLGLVARGFQFLRELDRDGRSAVSITSLASGNQAAAQTLLGGRAGLPVYRPMATWLTRGLPLVRWRAYAGRTRVQPARPDDLPDMVRFWNTVGPRRDLFAVVRESDFEPGGTFPGLRVEDIQLAVSGGRIVGTFALWDQTAFRQITVEGYSRWLRWLLPVVNTANAWRGLPRLPQPGAPLPCVYGTLFVVADDHADVARSLVAAAARAYAGPAAVAVLGFDARCPLASVFPRGLGGTYETIIYVVSWDDHDLRGWTVDRAIHLEEGCL
jgi:hypothetical protein